MSGSHLNDDSGRLLSIRLLSFPCSSLRSERQPEGEKILGDNHLEPTNFEERSRQTASVSSKSLSDCEFSFIPVNHTRDLIS